MKMRAIAYSIRLSEKEPLALANMRKHLITLITNPLTPDTAEFAEGKEAVIVSSCDELSQEILDRLVALGVRYLLIRNCNSQSLSIENFTRGNGSLQVADISFLYHQPKVNEYLILDQVASQIVFTLDRWEQNKEQENTYYPPNPYQTEDRIVRRSA